MSKFGPNYTFVVILGRKLAYVIYLVLFPTNKTSCLSGFLICVPELLLPHKIIRMFGPKTAIFAPKELSQTHALPAHLMHCWFVGWWLKRACCISQDTYLPYIIRGYWL